MNKLFSLVFAIGIIAASVVAADATPGRCSLNERSRLSSAVATLVSSPAPMAHARPSTRGITRAATTDIARPRTKPHAMRIGSVIITTAAT